MVVRRFAPLKRECSTAAADTAPTAARCRLPACLRASAQIDKLYATIATHQTRRILHDPRDLDTVARLMPNSLCRRRRDETRQFATVQAKFGTNQITDIAKTAVNWFLRRDAMLARVLTVVVCLPTRRYRPIVSKRQH